MFGLGMTEILLILAIALIVVGPKKLPELAKTLGKAMGEFKRSAQDLKRSMDIETTVNDDIDVPKTDLNKILNETPIEQAETRETDPATGDAGFTDSEKTKTPESGETAQAPDHPKTDTPS